MSSSSPFVSYTFAILGALDTISREQCAELIARNGGRIVEDVQNKARRRRITHIVASPELEALYDSKSVSQFYPGMHEMIAEALDKETPIVTEGFVIDTDKTKQKLLEKSYQLFLKPRGDSSSLDPRLVSLLELLFDRTPAKAELRSLGINESFIDTASCSKISEAFDALDTVSRALLAHAPTRSETEAFKSIVPIVGELDKEAYDKDDVDALRKVVGSIVNFGRTAELLRSISDKTSLEKLYNDLQTKLTPIDKTDPVFGHIERAIKNTQSVFYPDFTLNLIDVFSVERKGEAEAFEKYASLANHRLLWHGSRLVNILGILRDGLRIAPSVAPLHGQFLGKGIYLADMASKSAWYCHPTKEQKTIVLLLVEGACGDWFETSHSKYIELSSLKKNGFDSTKGWGKFEPNKSMNVCLNPDENCIFATGTETATDVIDTELDLNEFVFYDSEQVTIKYLIKADVIFE